MSMSKAFRAETERNPAKAVRTPLPNLSLCPTALRAEFHPVMQKTRKNQKKLVSALAYMQGLAGTKQIGK